jgi:CRP/FNR family transcriptional regulator, cyclic AMP receptor protein
VRHDVEYVVAEDEGAKLNHDEWPENSLLGRLCPRTREALLELGTGTTYASRETVIRQGDEGRSVVVVLSGLVKVVADTEFGRPVLLALCGRGDLVGEMAALEGVPRSANVHTCTPVRARLINHSRLREFLDRNPDAWFGLASSLSERLHWANARRVEFVASPAPVRVARVLVELAQQFGERTPFGWDLDISLTQADIASLAGVALATFEKAVQEMERLGLLRRRYRRIVLSDLAALRRFGESGSRKPISVWGL